MAPPTGILLAVAGFLTLTVISGVDATVVTTCKAAADRDARVDCGFCVSELGLHRDSPDADTWGLAKVAALTGVNGADSAVADIKGLLAKPGADAAGKAALARCQKLYDGVGFAFAEAQDSINNRDYAAGKDKAAEAVSLARQCDDAFAKDAVPSSITQHSSYAVKIAIICQAITSLIQ